jgi:sec-independent protein translocase protein TatB
MFDIGYSELLLIAIVTLLVVGPKELPNLLRTVGKWTAKARSMARHFRSGFDTMVREAEIEEMNKQWASHNAAIMGASGAVPDLTDLPEPERDADLHDIADLPAPAGATPAAPAGAIPAAPTAPLPPAGQAAPAKPKRARTRKPADPPTVPPAP